MIVDTSVWIDFLRGDLNEELSSFLKTTLENNQVSLTDIIYHELLVGARSKYDYDKLSELLSSLPRLRINDSEVEAFALFAWELCRKGLTGKYTDLTIAYLSRSCKQPVLSLDAYFHRLASLGIIEVVPVRSI